MNNLSIQNYRHIRSFRSGAGLHDDTADSEYRGDDRGSPGNDSGAHRADSEVHGDDRGGGQTAGTEGVCVC